MKTIRFALVMISLCGALACATPNTGTASAAPPAKADITSSAMDGIVKPEPVTHQLKAQARSHQSVGVRYLQDGKVALAIRELRAAEKLNPADKWIQLSLGEAYRRKGLVEDSEHHTLTALVIDPEFQEARLTLSGLYVQAERYPEAIAHAQLLVDDPTFPQPWLALTNQGYAEMKIGDRAAARETLELAVDYHDGYWRAILNLAILDSEEGKSLDAIQRFERVTELEPGALGIAEANYRIAEIYMGFGNRDRAIHHFAEAASTQYSGTWGKRSEDYLKRLR
jgi:tetratricopeptide (TPR) repeat protein